MLGLAAIYALLALTVIVALPPLVLPESVTLFPPAKTSRPVMTPVSPEVLPPVDRPPLNAPPAAKVAVAVTVEPFSPNETLLELLKTSVPEPLTASWPGPPRRPAPHPGTGDRHALPA